MKKSTLIIALTIVFLSSTFAGKPVFAFNWKDTIVNNTNQAIQTIMTEFIENGKDTINIDGVLAKFESLHKEVKQEGDYYISCADFTAGKSTYDIDYYVKKTGGISVDKVVYHKKDGKEVNTTLWDKSSGIDFSALFPQPDANQEKKTADETTQSSSVLSLFKNSIKDKNES